MRDIIYDLIFRRTESGTRVRSVGTVSEGAKFVVSLQQGLPVCRDGWEASSVGGTSNSGSPHSGLLVASAGDLPKAGANTRLSSRSSWANCG